MSWTVDPASDVPPSRQLVEAVLDAVARGELVAGQKLPSVRRMAAEALVNPNTVARAYRDLDHMGAVQGQNGRGVFVTERGPKIAREARRGATLSAFIRATREALRAGHTPVELQRIVLEKGEVRKTG